MKRLRALLEKFSREYKYKPDQEVYVPGIEKMGVISTCGHGKEGQNIYFVKYDSGEGWWREDEIIPRQEWRHVGGSKRGIDGGILRSGK